VTYLDEQVRALSARAADDEVDKESLQKMLANLGASLKEERLGNAQLRREAAAAVAATHHDALEGSGDRDGDEDGAAGTTAAEDLSGSDDASGVGGAGAEVGTGGGGGVVASAGAGKDGVSTASGWENLASLVRNGISGGWLVEPTEVVEGDVLGSGCSGVTMAGKWRGQLVAVGGRD
jgi:hypothetical protein